MLQQCQGSTFQFPCPRISTAHFTQEGKKMLHSVERQLALPRLRRSLGCNFPEEGKERSEGPAQHPDRSCEHETW